MSSYLPIVHDPFPVCGLSYRLLFHPHRPLLIILLDYSYLCAPYGTFDPRKSPALVWKEVVWLTCSEHFSLMLSVLMCICVTSRINSTLCLARVLTFTRLFCSVKFTAKSRFLHDSYLYQHPALLFARIPHCTRRNAGVS